MSAFRGKADIGRTIAHRPQFMSTRPGPFMSHATTYIRCIARPLQASSRAAQSRKPGRPPFPQRRTAAKLELKSGEGAQGRGLKLALNLAFLTGV
jgi:hypothetical protein